MRTNKSKFRVAVLAIAVLMSTSFVIAQGQGRGQGQKCKGENAQRMLPNLTEEQQEQIKALKLEHRAEVTKQQANLGVLRAELKQLTVADTPNDNKVYAKVDEITALKGTMMKSAYKHRQSVRVLLTDEQKVIFDARANKGFGKHDRAAAHGKGFKGPRNPEASSERGYYRQMN